MNINFNIYQSIIFGELRPWLNKLNEDTHKHILSQHQQIQTYTSIEDLNNSLTIIANNNLLISKSDTYTIEVHPTNDKPKADYPDIFEHLIYIDFPKSNNNLTDYYKYIISAEAIRLVSALNKSLSFYNKEQAKYPVLLFIEQIEQYLEETEKHITNTLFRTDFIFKILYTTLVKIRLEIQHLYPKLITSKPVNQTDLFKYFPEIKVITSNLYYFKIQKIFQSNKFDKSEILSLIENIRHDYINFSKSNSSGKEQIELNEKQIQNIRTLENIICIDKLGFFKGNKKISAQLEQQNINKIKSDYQDIIISKLEKTDSPAIRTSLISEELNKFSFLNSNHIIENPKLELSLPRELRTWLNKIEEAYKINPNYVPAELKENPKLKTNLSVPELATLFRELQKLKPDIFDIKSKAELHRFISNNFTSKKQENISTSSIKNNFDNPDSKAADFWIEKLRTIISNLKKF